MNTFFPIFHVVVTISNIRKSIERIAEDRRNARFQFCLQRDADLRIAAIKNFFCLGAPHEQA